MMRRFLSLMLLTPISFACGAAPVIDLCIDDCNESLPYEVSEEAWQQVRDLFDPATADAATERRQLVKAVALLERDMIPQTAGYTGDDSGGKLEDLFSNLDQARNTGKLITLMIDNRLVIRHVLRRSEKRESVFGYSQSTAVIQSLADSRIYAVYAAGSDFGAPPVLEKLSRWKEGTPLKTLVSGVKHLLFDDGPVKIEDRPRDSE